MEFLGIVLIRIFAFSILHLGLLQPVLSVVEPLSLKRVIAVLHKVQQERRLVVLLETTMIGVELALLFVLEWVEAQVERA